MLKRPRRNFYLAYFLAALPDWMPRMPSKRFWAWLVCVFSFSFLSLWIGLTVIGAREAEMWRIIATSIAITVPVQMIGMAIHAMIDQRRSRPIRRPRGFEVLQREDAH